MPFKSLSNNPETRIYDARAVGGTAAITQQEGDEFALTFVSTGIIRATWTFNPGTFLSAMAWASADTPGNVKSYIGVPTAFTAWDGSTATIDFHFFESGTLTDLAALEYANIVVKFKETSI